MTEDEVKELQKTYKEDYKFFINSLKGGCILSGFSFFTVMYFTARVYPKILSGLEILYLVFFYVLMAGIYGICAIALISDERSSKPAWWNEDDL